MVTCTRDHTINVADPGGVSTSGPGSKDPNAVYRVSAEFVDPSWVTLKPMESDNERNKWVREAQQMLETEGYVGLSANGADKNLVGVEEMSGITSGWVPKNASETVEEVEMRVQGRMRAKLGENLTDKKGRS